MGFDCVLPYHELKRIVLSVDVVHTTDSPCFTKVKIVSHLSLFVNPWVVLNALHIRHIVSGQGVVVQVEADLNLGFLALVDDGLQLVNQHLLFLSQLQSLTQAFMERLGAIVVDNLVIVEVVALLRAVV